MIEKLKYWKNPCISCLLDTENNNQKNDLWHNTWRVEEKELKEFIDKYKPKTILEIGSGTGRIIDLILKTNTNCNIVALESNRELYNFSRARFFKNKNVTLENKTIEEYIKTKNKFDLIICAMNTFGNINNKQLFLKLTKNSKYLFVSLYNTKYDKLRKDMYISRGHKKFKLINNTYYFKDCWVNGLKSKSYTKKQIVNLIKRLNVKYSINTKGILYILTINHNQ